MISAVLAIVVLPWQLYSSPVAVNYFLGGLGALLGPLFGIMFADYYLVRRGKIAVDDLYRDDPEGQYYFRRGWNPRALAVFAPSALITVVIALVPVFVDLAPFSWPIGVVLAGVLHLALNRPARRAAVVPAPSEP